MNAEAATVPTSALPQTACDDWQMPHQRFVSDVHLIWLPMDPKWDAIRNESSFQRLIERCGFAPSPAER